MMEEGQKLAVRLVGRNGRRRFDPASKDRLISACLESGASVSKLALEHGVNANLVWKWIKKAKEVRVLPPSSTSAFLLVQITAASSLPMQSSAFALEMPATDGEERRSQSERIDRLSSPAKVSASLPNDVKLTPQCSDLDVLAAIIGALGHVQTGR